ncbi:MAG: hypothetical protein BM564_01605 [Bacteroidetes bacterium MedPE-SWsnd-G2]|nr:MAG: hypothetical protein BM564_01605 [Bacteroidetes bacterium MedPE-SWsnd-G2]
MTSPLFKYQFWHAFLLAILLICLYQITKHHPIILQGELWDVPTKTWFVIAVLVPICHQIYVWLCWRLQLHHKTITKSLGERGFTIYKIGFAILIILRPVSLTFLAISNANTFRINSTLSMSLTVICLLLSGYLFYSVKRYFTADRAFGKDHFYPDIFKSKPFVKGGIFKYTSNGMYIYGFLLLYVPGLIWQSQAAILIALFNHIYIWVHFYTVEQPDIKLIYNSK